MKSNSVTMDTNSFIVFVKTEGIDKNFAEDAATRFDTWADNYKSKEQENLCCNETWFRRKNHEINGWVESKNL